MIHGWLFSFLVFLLIALAVALLFSLSALIRGKDEPWLTVPHYLQERFQSFFKKGIVNGFFLSLYFVACLALVPFVLTLYCVSLPVKIYTITYEDGAPARTWYTTVGKRIVHGETVIPVDRKMVYIFNDTNKTFCLRSVHYSSSGYGGSERPDFFLITPHAYIETEHEPDFWFKHPETISVPEGNSQATRWMVEPMDSELLNP